MKKIREKTSSFVAILIIILVIIFILAVIIFICCLILIIVGTEYKSYLSLLKFLMIFSAVSIPFDYLYSMVWNKLLRKPEIALFDKIFLFVGLMSVSIISIVLTDYFLESINIPAPGVISLAVIVTLIEMYLELERSE